MRKLFILIFFTAISLLGFTRPTENNKTTDSQIKTEGGEGYYNFAYINIRRNSWNTFSVDYGINSALTQSVVKPSFVEVYLFDANDSLIKIFSSTSFTIDDVYLGSGDEFRVQLTAGVEQYVLLGSKTFKSSRKSIVFENNINYPVNESYNDFEMDMNIRTFRRNYERNDKMDKIKNLAKNGMFVVLTHNETGESIEIPIENGKNKVNLAKDENYKEFLNWVHNDLNTLKMPDISLVYKFVIGNVVYTAQPEDEASWFPLIDALNNEESPLQAQN